MKMLMALLLSLSLISNPGCHNAATLVWVEGDGKFITRDIVRAQKEIPFQIILPSYIPGRISDRSIPEITGPLKSYQTATGGVEVEVTYTVDFVDSKPGVFMIYETSKLSLPPDPRVNPGWEVVEIDGISVTKQIEPKSQTAFYFSINEINFYVFFSDFYNYQEAIKVVESMIKEGKK